MNTEQMREFFRQNFYYIIAAGVGIGLLFGTLPLILGIRRGKRNLGLLALIVCGASGGASPILALIVAGIFTWLVLRGPRTTAAVPIISLGILGFILGGFIGFLMRPTVPGINAQLSFETVITRGANLQGLDQALIPLAQTSFNYTLAFAVIGIIVGVVIGYFFSKQRMRRISPNSSDVNTENS